MVSNWEEEKRPAKNHLAENSDERPGGIGSKAQDKVEWRRWLQPYVPAGMKRMSECVSKTAKLSKSIGKEEITHSTG